MAKQLAPNAIDKTSTPLEIVHALLQGKGPNQNGWYTACCPAHEDSSPSFGYREAGESVALNCYVGCTREEILKALELSERDLHKPGYKPAYRKAEYTVIDLATDKLILPALLHNYGVTDGFDYKNQATGRHQKMLRIEYRLRDGTPHTKLRLRRGPSGNKDSLFDENTAGDIMPYGLWKLDEAETVGYLLIGEGESDAWTCWRHGIPFLGIPGATNDTCLEWIDVKQEFGKIPRVYILQEPDQVKQAANLDQSGKGFYARVRSRLRAQGYTGEIFYVDFEQATRPYRAGPKGYKDPNALHQALCREKASARFVEIIETLRVTAVPAADDLDKPEEVTPISLADLDKAIAEKNAEAVLRQASTLERRSTNGKLTRKRKKWLAQEKRRSPQNDATSIMATPSRTLDQRRTGTEAYSQGQTLRVLAELSS